MVDGELLDITHASKRGTSIRISLPRKISERLGIGPEDIVGFYAENDRIYLSKLK